MFMTAGTWSGDLLENEKTPKKLKDEVHKLHVTIRTADKYRPLKWLRLDIKKTETKVSLKEIVKLKIISGGAMWPLDQKVFDNFLSYLQWKSKISKESAELVEKFDKRYDLLIVDQKTKKTINI